VKPAETPLASASVRAGTSSSDRVEYDVDVAEHVGKVDGRVVDDLVSAEFAQERMLRRSRSADHVRAQRLGDLHGYMSETAGCAVHEYTLAGLQLGRFRQRLPGSQAGQGQSGCLDVVDRSRFEGEVSRRRGDILRVRTGLPRKPRHPEDLVAYLVEGDSQTDSLDDPRHVVAEDRRVVP
jgi:hypothetical protein